MRDLLRLFTPPEWSVWSALDRLAYTASLAALLGLAALGAWKLHELIA